MAELVTAETGFCAPDKDAALASTSSNPASAVAAPFNFAFPWCREPRCGTTSIVAGENCGGGSASRGLPGLSECRLSSSSRFATRAALVVASRSESSLRECTAERPSAPPSPRA